MRTLYLECNMGAAGDMLMAALLELHPDKEDFLKRINEAGIPNVSIQAESAFKCGISGTHMKVTVSGQEEESGEQSHDDLHCSGQESNGHSHDSHGHAHGHGHSHTGMAQITEMINSLNIEETVKQDVKSIYELIAQAESRVHGKAVTEIHFHEVGMMDAIADITGCVMLLHELEIEKIIASPIQVGFGQIHCAHGILPVPAPATALLLEGIPCYAGTVEGELCTPTGAAILKYFVKEFTRLPQIAVEKIGYGMGKKDFPAANCIRAMLGETQGEGEQIIELCCNLDDMTAEEISFAMELLMEEGALDVYTTPIGMKKSRPGILFTVMCRADNREKMTELLFRHTTTIGIREACYDRKILSRREYTYESKMGEIRCKESTGYGIKRTKPEYEDLKKIALQTGMSLREIKEKL